MHPKPTTERDLEIARRYLEGERQREIAARLGMAQTNVSRILRRDGVRVTVIQRFWNNVDQSGGPDACWPWIGGKLTNGYGSLRVDGKHWLAHRRAWYLKHGPVPQGQLVLHECDNPPCCNDRHHFLGTHKANSEDCKAKDRHARGGRNGHAKLTRDLVEELRAIVPALPRGPGGKLRDGLMKDLVRGYGVGQSTISCAVRGKTWRHL